jgi:hypothetical protein
MRETLQGPKGDANDRKADPVVPNLVLFNKTQSFLEVFDD